MPFPMGLFRIFASISSPKRRVAEVASKLDGVALLGDPPGLAELRSAYRLDDQLGFAAG